MKLKINNYISESYVDGPGIRFTVFTQGCIHNCPGCHNPQTHDFNKGIYFDNEKIVELMNKNPLIEGLTLSGGDPLMQIDECLDLAKMVKNQDKNYDIVLYTGYTFEQIIEMGKKNDNLMELLKYIDYLIDGPFILKLRDLELNYCGSSNQRVIDVQKTLKENKIIIADIKKE